MHWAQKAKVTKEIRNYSATVGRSDYFQDWFRREPGPYVVSLVWVVTNQRRRDVGAGGPTLKAWIDGMVDAKLIVTDDHTVVAEERLRIEVGTKRGVRVEITPVAKEPQ
jgi:hypothetical protein